MNPQVTVLMPVYNGEAHIAEAIRSVLEQRFTGFELLIVNDGSTDGTAEVIQRFDDPRVRVVDRANGGVSAALNTGLGLARGKYIARFDADDICYPDRLEKQYSFMESHPDYVMIGTDAHYMTEEGEIIHLYRNVGHTDEELRQTIGQHCSFIHSSVMYRREDVLALGGYEVRAHTFEDYFLWKRLIARGKVCNLPEALMSVRFNTSSVTVDEKDQEPEFVNLKRKALDSGHISEEDGKRLLRAVRRLSYKKKNASYHRLLGKKFLWNNYQPGRARRHLVKSLLVEPFNSSSYLLFGLSFLPRQLIEKIYRRKKG